MARVVITGANKGIGLALARQMTERGDEVIATVRKTSGELSDLGVETIEGIDVADDAAVARLADALEGRTIDVLINNAGILTREGLHDLDWDAIRAQFETNTLGPLRVTRALLANMTDGSKVAILSSRMGSLAQNSGGSYAYRISKTAVNMVGSNLAIDLKDKGVAVVLLHPGYVATDINEHSGPVSTEESARGLIPLIDELTLEKSGTFWNFEGDELPW
ncbi:MAG: SDR family oxidoreductase [Hyphomicrobiaceae bacterium]|nr:SDR family oxidoreductase [Hyphomicrobiaceae bacterium]